MMRTLLLFVFALAIMGSSMGQKAGLKAVPYGRTSHPTSVSILDNAAPNSTVINPVVLPNRPKSTSTIVLDTMWLGGSRNAYTLLIPQQRGLWYDHSTNTLVMNYRGNPGISGYMNYVYLTGNDMVNSWSTDQGTTWVKKTGMLGVTGQTAYRYPSGVISNPAGNTDPNNTYAVMAGPATDGSAWISTYFASVKFDGTNPNLQTVPMSSLGELLRQDLTATEDGKLHFSGDGYLTDYTSSTLMIRNGTMDYGTGVIDWTSVDISLDDLIARKTDNTLISFFGDSHMAWNNSGTVGYALVRGSDIRATDPTSWYPIIFKSTDAGETWNQIPYFDFSTLTSITDWINPVAGDASVFKPMFTDFALTVDANDMPHLFSIIRGAASQNIDSLTYIWTWNGTTDPYDADCNYFELWPSADMTSWTAYHIDTVWTSEVDAAHSWYTSSTGNVGWDHRLQASRSYDGKRLFCTWADGDYKFWNTKKYLLNPDIFVFGRDIENGHVLPPTNYTYFTDVFGISFFDFVSPITYEPSPGVDEIPLRVSDIQSTGLSADNPTYHIYVKGMLADLYVGTNDIKGSSVSVSETYPNPSNGRSFIDVNLNNNTNVSVSVSNIAGQVVLTKDYGFVQKGTHQLVVDNSKLSNGVYFCTITVGDQKVTRKMVVN